MKNKPYMRVMGTVDRRKADVSEAVAFDAFLHVMETWPS